MPNTKLRQLGADLVCYALLDMIVDHYFIVMEKLGIRIEEVEDEVTRGNNPRSLTHGTLLKKELIILKRNFSPVREVVNGFLRNIRQPVIHPVLPLHYLSRNPPLAIPSTLNNASQVGDQMPVYRMSPIEPWREARAKLWANDKKPGDKTGDGVGGVWKVAKP
jgi:hypothetical protein